MTQKRRRLTYSQLLHACERKIIDGPGNGQQLGNGGQTHPWNAILTIDVNIHRVVNVIRDSLVTSEEKRNKINVSNNLGEKVSRTLD